MIQIGIVATCVMQKETACWAQKQNKTNKTKQTNKKKTSKGTLIPPNVPWQNGV